ncbi:MAG: AzlC family ABC transporter permease [Spirochaetes bacterium]|nr:AzlC family ABC transporter permease [Spirochaetota bacterium]MBL7006083.1 AzlC family ABC transporter permease [Spirochaetia bacterium]
MSRLKTKTVSNNPIQRGVTAGFPIFIGYFPAAMAFGLIANSIDLTLYESMLFSMVLFAGASQFFALNLIASGAAVYEIVIGIILVNLRHLLMSASLSRRTTAASIGARLMIAFGNTDEVFATASSSEGPIETPYLAALEITAWTGWVSGTLAGFIGGSFLPSGLQQSIGITLYGMFAALLVHNVQKEYWYIPVAAAAAGLNTILVRVIHLQPGWAFALSMILASLLGAAILPKVSETFREAEIEL